MTTPIQLSGGPKIGAPAGNALPPYLQTRTPTGVPGVGGQTPTSPVIAPKSTAVPGEVAQATPGAMKSAVATPATPPPATAISPSGSLVSSKANPNLETPQPPQLGGSNLQGVYNYFKSDLQNQTKQAMANTTSDAAARGVYYGSPLTGSEADINTQYLRGLGQLQAGMFGNEQQMELARLGLGANMNAMAAFNQPQVPGIDNSLFSNLGALFANSPQNPVNNPANGNTPVISPRNGPVVGKQGK